MLDQMMVSVLGSVDAFSTMSPQELRQSGEPIVLGASVFESCGGTTLSPFAKPVLPGAVSGALTLDVPMGMPEPPAALADDRGSPLVPKRSFGRNDEHPNSKKGEINRAAQRHSLQTFEWFSLVATNFLLLWNSKSKTQSIWEGDVVVL